MFYQLGRHWDARLITGLVVTCGGVVVICVLLTIIIGVPFAIRILHEAGHADKAWRQLPPYPPSYPTLMASHPSPSNWAQEPPRLEAKQGSWHRLDNAYDNWEDEALNH